MLTENDVVEAVSLYLIKNGYEIKQKLTTIQTGIDIVAMNPDGIHCYIEAKGATSSKSESLRYGKEFNQSQVKTHVGMALVAAFKLMNEFPKAEVMIALPNNTNHKTLITNMAIPISKSGVKVLLVSEQGIVQPYV